MFTFSFPHAGRWLVAAVLAAPLAATAQTMPAVPAMPAAPAMPATTTSAAAAVMPGTMGKAARVAEAYHAAPPEQRAARMSQQLAKELNLDAATTAKVQAAALLRAQKIDAIQTGTATNKEKNSALQANAQEYKTALQGILTPAQFAQYATKMGKGAMSKMATGAATPASE